MTLVHGRRRSSGCNTEWLLVGAAAWACNSPGTFELDGSRATLSSPVNDAPEYARIGSAGAIAYSSAAAAEQQLPDAELQPGFFVGLTEERPIQGEVYARTTHDLWIAKRDLMPVTASTFEGAEIEAAAADPLPLGQATSSSVAARAASRISPRVLDEVFELGHLRLGWVFVDNAIARRAIQGAPNPRGKLARLSRVQVLEVRLHNDGHEWYRVTDGWLSDRQLRVPVVALPPASVSPNERWLDVDKRTQTLVAYVGQTPVFATLVSTGRGLDGTPTASPAGLHRIWVKLATTDMDNLDEQNVAENTTAPAEPYAVEAVPFVMYFLRGYGLHATYWHDAFGTPRSHGCVNLSVRDAARLFEFSSPKLAPGWQAVHPFGHDPGTLVRVR